jgi:hypothetical protein
MRYLLALTLTVAACGPMPAPSCPPAYPNPAPGELCCDAAWAWCQRSDGRIIGAP